MTKEQLDFLKEKNIGLLKEFIRVADKYKIPYSLSSGNILGAVRHNGHFIPWDTDVDIDVSWKYEEKLRNVFSKEIKKPFVYVDTSIFPLAKSSFPMIIDTSIVPENYREYYGDRHSRSFDKHVPKGLPLDIFIWYPAGDNKSIKKMKKTCFCRWFRNCNWNDLDDKIASVFTKIIPNSYLLKRLDKLKQKAINPSSKRSFTLFMGGSTKDFPANIEYYSLKKIKFEGVEVYSHKNDIEYLESLYGKGWTDSPKEPRIEPWIWKK